MSVNAKRSNSGAGTAQGGTYAFPTTFAQQRLWFLEQLQPGGTSYLIPWFLRATGKLTVEALERSLNQIIERHEILRTTFSWKDEMPVQVVRPALTLNLAVRDISACTNPLAEAEKLAREEAHQPLNLERGPLVRAQLLRLSEEDHVLLLTLHHIIFDGGSRRTLVRELAAFYEANCAGKPAQLPPPKLQYADYAVWQRKHCQGATLETHLAYWRKQLAGSPASLELPTDHPRPAVQSFNGAKLPIAISKDLAGRLNSFSRSQGATLFITLLAAFETLLSRWSNQDDIVVGTPIANRNRAEVEDMIGFFANTLALRTRFSEGASFLEVLAQVKETTLDAYDHQDLPFEKLVEEIQPERNLSQNPLFQVLFSLQNLVRPDFELSGLKLRFIDRDETAAKFDVSVFLSETAEGIGGRIEYNTDLFDRETIERMVAHYRQLLETVVERPEMRVSDIPLLTEVERRQVLKEWNATAAEYPRDRCVHQLIEEQAARTPHAIAVRMGEDEISYGSLNERSNQLAWGLRKRGAGPGGRVGICVERSIDMIVGLVAIMKSGAAYVPLDPAYPAERIKLILDDGQPAVLLTQQSLAATLPATDARVVLIDSDWSEIRKESTASPSPSATPEDLAYIIFTSGSTGKPKGVEIEHRSLTNLVASIERQPGFSSEDRLLAVTTLSFDIAGLELYVPLVSGGEIVLASRLEAADGRRLRKLLNDYRPTVMQATPATWRMLIESGWQGEPELKILCGGEALPGDLSAQLLPRCAELWNMYGPTETTIWSSLYRVSSAAATAPIGRPLANTTFYVLDSARQPVPVGVAGELYIGGEGVGRGYFERPDLTEQRFVPDPFDPRPGARLYRTGDVARYLRDGNVQYLGRSDFQVKVRGFRIELGEIEAVLAQHPAVRQAVVAVREDAPGDKRLIAYVVPKTDEHLTISEARAHLKRSLPDYMLPSAMVELDRLPLTPNGKVDRKALPKPESAPAATADMVAPRDAVEVKLLNIWRDVLKLSAAGVTDNFFDVGGHSLLAVRLVEEIRKATGVEIPLTALFQGATIEHLANLVRGTETVAQAVVHRLQAGSADRAPFFAAVLAGVNALGYVPLAKHLGPEQPFYALQRPGPGPHAQRRPYSPQEYEEVAAEYVRGMRSIQPDGPYYIGGTCEGARIAFEMARMLEAQGQKVALLAIIDTWVVENTQNRRLWRLYYYSVRLRQNWKRPLKDQLAWATRAVGNQIRRWLGAKSAPAKSAWIEVYWPSRDFVTSPVQSPITIYKIRKQPFYYHPDPLLGWGNRTTARVYTQVIPQGRHRLLLREPYVRELAAALSRTLQQLHPPVSGTETGTQNEHAEVVGAQ